MRSTCQTWSPPTSQTWTQMWFHIRLKLFSVLPSSSGRRGWRRWTRQSTAEAPTDGRSILGHGSNSGFNKEKYPPSKLPIKRAHDKKRLIFWYLMNLVFKLYKLSQRYWAGSRNPSSTILQEIRLWSESAHEVLLPQVCPVGVCQRPDWSVGIRPVCWFLI